MKCVYSFSINVIFTKKPENEPECSWLHYLMASFLETLLHKLEVLDIIFDVSELWRRAEPLMTSSRDKN